MTANEKNDAQQQASANQSDSIQSLARHWDMHDLADFENNLDEVAEAVFEWATTVTIHRSSADAAVVNAVLKFTGSWRQSRKLG